MTLKKNIKVERNTQIKKRENKVKKECYFFVYMYICIGLHTQE